MPAIFHFEHTVLPSEMDVQQHVNNLAYMKWLQDAAVAHSDAQGWTRREYEELGAGWVVKRHTIEYIRPAFEGDRIVVETWVSNFRKIQSLRKYRVLRPSDDAELAIAETNWVFVNIDNHLPRRVPAELRDAFIIVSDEERQSRSL